MVDTFTVWKIEDNLLLTDLGKVSCYLKRENATIEIRNIKRTRKHQEKNIQTNANEYRLLIKFIDNHSTVGLCC